MSSPGFPFLSLPLEIRIKIYALIILKPGEETNMYKSMTPLDTSPSYNRNGKMIQSEDYQFRQPSLAIAFTCRQAYQEVGSPRYLAETFVFRNSLDMREWQEDVSLRNCAAVRSLFVEAGKAGVGSESFGEVLDLTLLAQKFNTHKFELRLDTVWDQFMPYRDGVTSVLGEWMFLDCYKSEKSGYSVAKCGLSASPSGLRPSIQVLS